MKFLKKSITVFACLWMASICGYAQDENEDRYDLNQTYKMSPTGTLHLQSNDAYVKIRGADREDVLLVVHYRLEVRGVTIGKKDQFSMEVTEQAGDLEIREKPGRAKSGNINIGYLDKDYTITLTVPRGISLNIEGDDDAYEISGVDGSIRMNTDDSETVVRRCAGNMFRFDFDDGKIIMDGGRGELRVSNDDGDTDIRNGDFDWINIDSDDGTIRISTRFSDEGDYTFTTDDGLIDLRVLGGGGEVRVNHDEVEVYAATEFRVIRKDANYDEFRLPGGNARVRIETDNGEVRLDTE